MTDKLLEIRLVINQMIFNKEITKKSGNKLLKIIELETVTYLKPSLKIPKLSKRTESKFWKKVTKTKGCWFWNASKRSKGYGAFTINYKTYLAHRVSLVIHGIELIDGYVIDHLCNNKLCVNPAHLEQVTNRDNVLRSYGISSKNMMKTHCHRGHKLSGDNVVFRNPQRGCKACWKITARTKYNKKVDKKA